MIAVAGLNSSIDKLLDVDTLTPGFVIRARAAHAWPGGKGAHVAMCAAALGEAVRLTGLVDEAHRELFIGWMRARRVDFHAIDMVPPIRTCLAIRDRHGSITEILEPGPALDAARCEAAFDAVVRVCRTARVAVLCGSLPPAMPGTTYGDLVRALPDTRVLVDASGDLLRHALGAAPYAIKPNRVEAQALTGMTIESPGSAARVARALMSTGVRLIVVSLGAEGAVACWNDRVCHVRPPEVAPMNAVGAGDCLLGALAAALARGDELVDALRLGVAAGTAKVLSTETGVVRRTDIDAVLPAVRVDWLS
jgi:1-phosphofructokinase family hexose kinase